MTDYWSLYFNEEVKIVFFEYGLPDALCHLVASFALGIQYIQAEADRIRDYKIANIILGANREITDTRVMSCRDYQWATPYVNKEAGGYYMDYSRCSGLCRVNLNVETNLDEMTLWNLKLVNNMFDFLFEANSSTRYDNVALHEIKIAILSQKQRIRTTLMIEHLRGSLFQITRAKQFSMWYGDDKYSYGYYGTPTACIILQHVEDTNNEMIDQGYKFGRTYTESDRCTLWRNRIYSKQSADLKAVVLHLIPYAQFSSLAAVNELIRVLSKKN
jgi:hypothetical protein